MRTISATALKAMFSQNSDVAFFALLTVSHPTWTTTYRYINDIIDLDYNGITFTALPFEVTLPPDTDENPPTVTVKVDNIDRQLVELLRTLTTPLDASLEVISRVKSPTSPIPAQYAMVQIWDNFTHEYQPEQLIRIVGEPVYYVNSEIGPMPFKVLSYNNMSYASIEIELGYEADILNEPATRDTFSPSVAPGLF